MNLFDNIINQSKSSFLGTQPTPTVPSFMTQLQAPRTTNYTQPIQSTLPVAPKPSMTLFSDEKGMLDNIRKAGISDEKAFDMIKRRRTDLLGGNNITQDETEMLKNMINANVRADDAVAMIQKRRQDMETKANSIHDLHADEGVIEQTLKAPFRAIGDVASQTWQGIGKGTEGLIDASFRGVNDLNKMIGSSDYSPELEKKLPQGGYLGDVAKIGAGTTGAIFNLGKAPLALGINTANQLPGAQYITQGIGKGIEYGAENIGEMAAIDKNTSMDLATTGMNLLGMKPGMNTLQYGKGIANAQGVAGKAGAIVKPVAESVVQTVKMPYDIAKGTIKGGVNTAKKLQPALASTADSIQTGINRMNAGEVNKFHAEQGVSPGKYLNDRPRLLKGNIEENLLTEMKSSRDQATAGMDAIVGNYKMPERQFGDKKIDYLREMLMDNYAKAKDTLDAEGLTKAQELLRKYDTEGLTMSEINQSKRKMATNNPVNWLTDSASTRVQTIKKISDEVRNWQFDQAEKAGFTNLKEINKQTQALYKLHEGISKWNEKIDAKNKISLTDYLAFDADPAVFVAKKVLSNPTVRQGLVKGLNKMSGRVAKPIEKANIENINTKRAEYDFGNRNSNTGDRVDTRKPLALKPATKEQLLAEKTIQPEITDKSVIKRPTTPTRAEVQLAKQSQRQAEVQSIEKELNTALLSKYNPNKPETTKRFIESRITQGKLKKEEAIPMVENLYEKANGFDKPHYEKIINDLYSNKKIESFDDLLNEKIVAPQQIDMTPKEIYKKLNKMANDGRFGEKSWNTLAEEFKQKTGVDIMNDPIPQFDASGNVQKTIVRPSPQVKPVEKTVKTTDKNAVKDAVGNWKPVNGKYTVSNIDISKTNAFPRAKYHKEDYVNTPSYKYWLEQAKKGANIPPVVVEKTPTGYNVVDGYHRLAAIEDAGIKNVKAIVLDTPVIKGEKAKGIKQFTSFSDAEIEKMLKPKK